jgi:ankyrin repeat protein
MGLKKTVSREQDLIIPNWSPLTWAAVTGREEVVELLSSHAQPNTRIGSMALCWAAYSDHNSETTRLLSAFQVRLKPVETTRCRHQHGTFT